MEIFQRVPIINVKMREKKNANEFYHVEQNEKLEEKNVSQVAN